MLQAIAAAKKKENDRIDAGKLQGRPLDVQEGD
jgi:hypothetical protein